MDPKSPQGTAAAFSKANKQALHMANSSLLLEFARSREDLRCGRYYPHQATRPCPPSALQGSPGGKASKVGGHGSLAASRR